jgi:hypothetical protein
MYYISQRQGISFDYSYLLIWGVFYFTLGPQISLVFCDPYVFYVRYEKNILYMLLLLLLLLLEVPWCIIYIII